MQRAADIVSRLPLHHKLTSSQAWLVKLTPTWRAWLHSAIARGTISKQCADAAQLTAWHAEQQKLVISCDNAINATQIKHQLQSLLEYLNQQQTQQINRIVVRLSMGTGELALNPATHSDQNLAHQADDAAQRSTTKLDKSSVSALENCRKRVTNDELAAALKKLTDTLKSV